MTEYSSSYTYPYSSIENNNSDDLLKYFYNIQTSSKAKKKKSNRKKQLDVLYNSPLAIGNDLFTISNRLHIQVGKNIPEDMILEIGYDSGVYLGLETDYGKGYFVGKSSKQDGNVITVGVNGSGKSFIISKSTIETWRDPFVVLDIKGELSAHYYKLFRSGKVTRPFVVFDPNNLSACYDVYNLLRKNNSSLEQNVREIAFAIIPMPHDIRETYWIDMARDMFSAAILFFFNRNCSFIESIIAIQTTPVEKLCDKINREGCEKAKMFISEIGNLKPEQMASIGSELKKNTMVFATDEFIQAALSNDDDKNITFSWDDVIKEEEPINVFLCLPQDKLEQWSSVIRLMLVQLIRTLERRPDKYSVQSKNYPPVLILLDEFPLLGKIDIISSSLTTLRSKNVTFCLMLQSLAQLDYIYGKDTRRIIFDNCQYKAILNVTEPDSQRYLSELFGFIKVLKRSISENYDPYIDRRNYGRQIQEEREQLIHAHEFATNKNILLYTPHGYLCSEKYPVSVTHMHVFDFERLLNKQK